MLLVRHASSAEADFSYLEDLPAVIQRRVRALKEVQSRFDEVNSLYQKEKAVLEAKFISQYAPLLDERAEIVAGKREVPAYDIADGGEKDEGLPEFWLVALLNHDVVGREINARDEEVLKHLVDVRAEVLTGDDFGYKLIFTFEPNKFFSNTVLTKTYFMEPVDDAIPRKFVGSEIEWKEGQDVTVELVKQRVKDRKAKGKNAVTTITKSQPCQSFFNFFSPPALPENPDDLTDEQLDTLQDQFDTDYEIGLAIKEQIIPRAVEWYTGEAAPLDAEGGELDEFDEFEDGEFEEEPAAPARKK